MSTHRSDYAGHVIVKVEHVVDALTLVELLYSTSLFDDYTPPLAAKPGKRAVRKAVEDQLSRRGSEVFHFRGFDADIEYASTFDEAITKLSWCSALIQEAYEVNALHEVAEAIADAIRKRPQDA